MDSEVLEATEALATSFLVNIQNRNTVLEWVFGRPFCMSPNRKLLKIFQVCPEIKFSDQLRLCTRHDFVRAEENRKLGYVYLNVVPKMSFVFNFVCSQPHKILTLVEKFNFVVYWIFKQKKRKKFLSIDLIAPLSYLVESPLIPKVILTTKKTNWK